jgi:hypothetical protein
MASLASILNRDELRAFHVAESAARPAQTAVGRKQEFWHEKSASRRQSKGQSKTTNPQATVWPIFLSEIEQNLAVRKPRLLVPNVLASYYKCEV